MFSCCPVPSPRDPYSQFRAAIATSLPQELLKIVDYDADVGLGCFFDVEYKSGRFPLDADHDV